MYFRCKNVSQLIKHYLYLHFLCVSCKYRMSSSYQAREKRYLKHLIKVYFIKAHYWIPMNYEVFDGQQMQTKKKYFTEACSLLKRALLIASPPWPHSCIHFNLSFIRADLAWFPSITDGQVPGSRHRAPSVVLLGLGQVEILLLLITKTLFGSLINCITNFLY